MNDKTTILIEDLKLPLNRLQQQTIGYLEMSRESFEPIIIKDGDYITTLVVSRALAIQTLNIRKDVFPTHIFPDGKTLSQMLDEPTKYYEFCEKNNIKHR